MANTRTPIGVIGCGNISGAYLDAQKKLDNLAVVACADLDMDRAKAAATKYGIEACSVEALLARGDVDIVVNLTIPRAHASVDLAAITAGKHVYSEKPLALDRAEGRRILDAAAQRNLRVGCAPDTFLGAGVQSCVKGVADGLIGDIVGASAFVAGHGHESWHPDPEFYYKPGGGPLFDMGPYYLTALVALIGRARRVTASTKASFAHRTITSEAKRGQKVDVEVATHCAGIIDFDNGATATLLASFDVWHPRLPCIELYGTLGTIAVPDPNGFKGPAMVRLAQDKEHRAVEQAHAVNSRGLGVADMAAAIRSGRTHRASGELAYHVLDIMCAFDESSRTGRHIEITSPCERPRAIPAGLVEGAIDA
jgi:predicted dehydrogenase